MRAFGKRDVRGDVFNQDPATKDFLDSQNAIGREVQRLLGIRQRQQVVEISVWPGAPAQMLGNKRRLYPVGELPDFRHMGLGKTFN